MTVPMRLVVRGDPQTQGSKRAVVHRSTGRAVVFEDNHAKLRTWRSDIMAAAGKWLAHEPAQPFEGPVAVSAEFVLRRPKRPKWDLPAVRPDVDKLARAVLDALTAAGVWHDDAQVTSLVVEKRYGESPGVEISAYAVEIVKEGVGV